MPWSALSPDEQEPLELDLLATILAFEEEVEERDAIIVTSRSDVGSVAQLLLFNL